MKYEIKPLRNYPDNGKHLYVSWNIPVMIAKGEDTWFYMDKNKEKETKSYLWVVYEYETFIDIKTKQFKDVEDAIAYAVKHYKKYLLAELKKLEEK